MQGMEGAEASYVCGDAENLVILKDESDVDLLIESMSSQGEEANLSQIFSLDRPMISPSVPDHEFLVGVKKARGVGVLSYAGEDGNFLSKGPDGEHVRYYLYGNIQDFPPGSEIPLDSLRSAVLEFVETKGRRPTCVDWIVPELWPWSADG